MLKIGERSATPYRGGYGPVNICKNGIQLAGWENHPVSGRSVEITGTYNAPATELVLNGKTELATSKNLCPLPQAYFEDVNNALTHNEDGTFNYISSEDSEGGLFVPNLQLPTGKYTISTNCTFLSVYLYGLTSDYVHVNGTLCLDASALPVVYLYVVIDDGAYNEQNVYVQIEEGTEATPYRPYLATSSGDPSPDNIRTIVSTKGIVTATGGITQPYNTLSFAGLPELRGIEVPATAPYTYAEKDENGVMHYYIADTLQGNTLTRRVGKKVFTGAEDYQKSSRTTQTAFCAVTTVSDAMLYSTPSMPMLRGYMNIGTVGSAANIADFETGFAYNTNVLHFLKIANAAIPNWLDEDTDAQKLTKFKAYLAGLYAAGTPVTVYYLLANPTYETVEVEQIQTRAKFTRLTVEPETYHPAYGLSGSVKVVKK